MGYGSTMVEKRKQFLNSVKISFWRCLLSEIKSYLISYGSETPLGPGSQGKSMSCLCYSLFYNVVGVTFAIIPDVSIISNVFS